MKVQPRILFVDDSESARAAIVDLLGQHGIMVTEAASGEEGVRAVFDSLPDLVLLDIDMPDLDGFAVCRQLKQSKQTDNIPVVFISGFDTVENRLESFASGGVDFIAKPYYPDELAARLLSHLDQLEARRSLEEARQAMEEWSSTLEAHVTERTRDIMRNERRMRYLAMHDSLTQLPNRNAMHENLTRIADSMETELAAVIYIDLEGFDDINRSYGHHTGDELIVQASERLKGVVDEWNQVDLVHAVLYQAGQAEFVVLIEQVDGEAAVIQAGEVLLAAMQEPFTIRETILYLPAAAGFSLFPEDGTEEEVLLQNAQMAMSDAKQHHDVPNRIHRFHPNLAHAARERMQRVHALRAAVLNRELFLHFQPKIDLASRQIIGVEALVRWCPDGETPLPPSVFIPLAEETGIIHDLGQLVLELTCQQIARWHEAGYAPPPVAINISPIQLTQYEFTEAFLRTLKQFRIDTRDIAIEITETAFLHEREQSTKVLDRLQRSGLNIHLDDFGTGYSSFTYLSDLPLNCVKIDKSFLDRCRPDLQEVAPAAPQDGERRVNHHTILEGIITLARGLQLEIVAEGVETPEQVEMLQDFGCQAAQGYYFFRPMPAEKLEQYLPAVSPSLSS